MYLKRTIDKQLDKWLISTNSSSLVVGIRQCGKTESIRNELDKANIQPYYFAKEIGLEIDFVISYNGFSTLVEAKTKNRKYQI